VTRPGGGIISPPAAVGSVRGFFPGLRSSRSHNLFLLPAVEELSATAAVSGKAVEELATVSSINKRSMNPDETHLERLHLPQLRILY
jgi:hypothetical protein